MILLIQVLLLTGVSCADASEFSSQDTTVKTLVTSTPDCNGDTCSPFCSCACCVGCTYPAATKAHIVKPELSNSSNYYAEPYCNSFNRSLFQPPKV